VTVFDLIVLALIGVSCVLGFWRGLLKELLSLIAYVLAFMVALWWGESVAAWFDSYIDHDLIRIGVAYGLVFLGALLLVGLVNLGAGLLVAKTGLTPADRGLGLLFGLVRGVLFIVLLVAVAGYTELPREAWWQDAYFSGLAVSGVQLLKTVLPPALAVWLPY